MPAAVKEVISIVYAVSTYMRRWMLSVSISPKKEFSSGQNIMTISSLCVTDLAEPPFCDEQFQVILNILSPSNYEAFRRLLKKDGFLLKVVPIVAYLQEIRQPLFVAPMKKTYSNEAIVEHFQNNFQLIDRKIIHHKTCLKGKYYRYS